MPEQAWIYKPFKGRFLEPASLGVRDCYFQASDGVRLNAWYLSAPAGQPTVLYFHGNGGSLSSMDRTLAEMKRARFGVLLVDYRGYGLSEGRPSEQGLYRDGLAAYDYCRELGVPVERLLIHGQSLGGGVATYVASRRACSGLILESTFTSFPAVASKVCGGGFPGRLAFLAVHTQFPNKQRVATLTIPVFVIHGARDELIPCSMGKALHAATRTGRFWVVDGAGHNNLRSAARSEYARRLGQFWSDLKSGKFSP
ncbi:MAG: alpha/beta hydrolase [Candidatus Eremiobacteraeota bacterium]|nr:alpha/beta hydrolase [Candidatus Eremiobacteraeota bacterium]MCW5869972.1 alpha/beta hydrolase [Candidatus Eremiobacteraeota bacterium]